MYARGTIVGITRGTTEQHIARAALESIAYQTVDVLEAMQKDSKREIEVLRVDGGGAQNQFLMQFQADLARLPIEVPVVTEMAALGAAYLAGLGVGFLSSKDELSENWRVNKRYEPKMSLDEREVLYSAWQLAVERSRNWARTAGS
jgi:glycerol kinase